MSPTITTDYPRHITLDQRTIAVFYPATLSGTASTSQYKVFINGFEVSVTGVSNNETGTFAATTPGLTANYVAVRFDAQTAPGHSNATPYLLPGEVLTINFTNSGTLLRQSDGVPVANFTNVQSKNTYSPLATGVGDMIFNGQNVASGSLRDQCAPVNTNFQTFTYIYSLRFRNSTRWTTANNKLHVVWGNGGDASDIPGYLSNSGGDPGAVTPVNSFTGGNPGVYVSFRPGLDVASLPAIVLNTNTINGYYSYPDNSGLCNFSATYYPIGVTTATYNSVGQAPQIQQSNFKFDSFDYDDANTGVLGLNPSVANSDLVCLGTNVNMTFTDVSTFNCIGSGTTLPVPPHAFTSPVNDQPRWVRIIYGGFNSPTPQGNIRDVYVGVDQVTDATTGALLPIYETGSHPILPGSYTDMTPNAAPMSRGYVSMAGGADANGVISLPAGTDVSTVITDIISTSSTANHAVGQRFYVTIQYWNVCNPYPTSAPVEASIDFIEIIDKPLPAVASDKNFCYNENMSTTPAGPAPPVSCTTCFEVTVASVTGNTEIKWYTTLADANSDVNAIVNDYGTQSRFLRPTETVTIASGGTGPIPNTAPAAGDTYSVWVRYRTGSAVPNNCLSDPQEVRIVKREQLTTPTITSTASFPICSNTNAVPFTTTTAPGTNILGGAWNYTWSLGAGALGTNLTINPAGPTTQNMTLDIASAATGGKRVMALRKYTVLTTDNKNCASSNFNFNFNVDLRPVGGSIGGGTTPICLGSSTGNMTLSGHSGNILRWEVDNGTGFNPIVNTSTTYSETPSAAGTYIYRAILGNGVCTNVPSNTFTVVVNQPPVSATFDGAATICSPASTNLTVAVVGGASPYSVTYNDGSGNTVVNGYVSGGNISVSPTSTRTYTLVAVVDANGCNAVTLSGTPVVTVSNPTSAVIDGDVSICPGQSTNFNVVVMGGVGPYTLRYRINGGAPITVNAYVSGANISTGALTPGTYSYTIEDVRDQNNCLSLLNSGTAIVDVGSTPSSATFSGGGSVCRDLLHNLALNITGGVAPFTLVIDNGIGTINNYTSGANIPVPTNVVGTTSYNVTLITDACGSTLGLITNNPQAVTVNDLPPAANQTPVVCSDNPGGTTATVNLTANNAAINATATITWFTAYNAGTKVFSGPIATPASAVVTHNTPVFARVQDGNTCVSPATVTYTVQPKAQITLQPSNSSICDLTNTTFTVNATGSDLSFQWEVDADGAGAGGFADVVNGGVFSGATTNTLTITGAPSATMNGDIFRVRVTSFSSGTPTCPVTSNPATLTVNEFPGITSHPVSDAECIGLNTSFNVVSTGTGLSFRWQIDADGPGAGGFVDINNGAAGGGLSYSGATTDNLSLTGLTAAINGAFYRVRISRATSCEIFSNAGTLTVHPLPTSVAFAPVLCDETPGLPLRVNSVTLSDYDDDVTNAPTVNWFTDPGRTIGVTTSLVNHGSTFYWRAQSADGCFNVGQVTFTVEDLPDAVDKSYSFCEDAVNAGVASNIDLTALEFGAAGVTNGDGNAGTRNVVWFSDATLTNPINDPITPGDEEVDFSISATTTVYAQVINTSSASAPDCYDVADVTLVYKPRPVNNPISGDLTLCSGPAVRVYQMNPATNNYGAVHNYEWTVTGSANFEVFEPGTGFTVTNSYNATTTDFLVIVKFPNAGNFVVSAKEIIDGCDGNTSSQNVSVTGAPAALTFNLPSTQVCKDQTGVTYSLTGANPSSVYTWTVIGGTVVGASSGVGLGTITVNWGSITLPQPSVSVTETNSNGCSGSPASINITLNDVPSITSPNATTICSGSTPNSVDPFAAEIGGVPCASCSFSWRIVNATANVTIGGLPVPIFPAAGSFGTGPIPSILVNNSGINGTVFYEVTATEGDSPSPPDCGSVTEAFTVTVKPEPVVNTVSNIVVCSQGSISAINFTGNAGGETFTWTNDNVAVGLPIGGIGNIGAFTAPYNPTSSDIVANITVTATKNGCTSVGSNSKTFTITVRPEPDYVGAAFTRCSDDALAFDLSTLKDGGLDATSFSITNIASGSLSASAGNPTTGTGFGILEIADDRWTNTTNATQDVTYTIVPVLNGCQGAFITITVTITPEPVYNNATPAICSDEIVGLDLASLRVGSSVAATSFNIVSIVNNGLTPGGGNVTATSGHPSTAIQNDTWTNTTSAPVNVVYTIVPDNGGCLGSSFTVTLIVNPEPVYNGTTPIVCSDDIVNVNFTTLKAVSSVTATAFNIIGIVDNGLTPGAGNVGIANGVSATAILNDRWTNTGALPEDVEYTVVPLNGTCAGTAFTVIVTVNPEPVYSNATPIRCSDDLVGLDLSTLKNGTGVDATTYNITINSGVLVATAGSPANGTGLPATEIADDRWRNTTNSPANVVYTIVPVTGTCQGTSFTVTVSVTPEPVYNNSTGVTRCSDENININFTTLRVPTSVSATTYNITNIDDNGLIPAAGNVGIANGVAANAIVNDQWTNTTSTSQFVEYTVVPVNGTCEGSAFTVTVTINPEPVYNNATPTICSDDIVNINFTTLKVGTSIAATSYNITNIVNNGGLTPAAGNVGIANGLSATAIVNDRWTNTTAASEDIEYTIVPINGTCAGSSFTVMVTVDPEPVYSNATPTRCSDDAVGIDLSTLKSGSGVDATTYNITINSNSLTASAGSPANGTGLLAMEISDDRWTNTTNSPVNVVYTIVPLTGSCAGTSFTVTVTVNPEPVYNNSTPTICSDENVNVNFTALKVGTSVTATTFNLTNIVNAAGLTPAGTNVAIGNGLSAAAILNDRWTNTTATPEDIEYTIVPVNGTCQGTPFTVVVTVNPEPVYDNAAPVRCSDELVNIDLSSLINGAGVTATGFTITSINANGLTPSGGSPANGINLGALVISDDRWTNTTANPVDVIYNITPLAGTCQGTPFTVTVTIHPEPVYTGTTVVRCSDDLVNIDLNTRKDITGVTATTFNITINSNSLTASAGAPVDGTGFNALEISDDRWTNTSLSPVNVVYTITPVNGSCLGTPFTITVTVNPEPVGASTSFTRCNEEQFSINLVSVMSAASVLPSTYNIVVSSGPLTFAGTSNSNGGGKNANELFDDKWINTTPDPEDVTYLITPVSASGCAGTPFTLTFTINPKPTAPLITTAQICSDGTFNFDLQSVVNNTVGGGNTVESVFRYTVTSNNAAVSPAGPRNTASDALINDTYENRSNANALITYTVIPISDLGCEGAPFEVRLTVFPEPVGVNIVNTDCITNLNHNIQTAHINAIGGNSLPSIFTYTVATSNAGAVPAGPNRVVASNANITDSYVNTSGADVTITYTITPFNSTNPTCGGTPFTFQVVISSRPVGADGSVTAVCSDNTFTINPQNNITNGVVSTFTWTVSYDAGLTGPVSGSGATITGSLTNNTTGLKNAYFEVTPTSGTCSGVSYTITQPINPEPVIDPSVTPRTICSDTPTNIVFSALGGTETPTLFDISLITQDPDLTGTPTTGLALAANAIQNNSYTNNHRTQGLIVQYLVTPYGPAGVGGCQGNDLIVQIEVLPEPVIEPTLSSVSICSDVASGIQIETDGISIGATSFFINSVTAQSTATTIAPNTTVASLTSAVSNITADPSIVTGARSKGFIQNDKFTVTVADAVNANNTVVYNVTPRSAAGCFGNAANINLLVLPEPQFDPIAPPPVCSDATIDLQLIQRDPTSTLIAQYNITGITFQPGLIPGGSNILIGSVKTADANGDVTGADRIMDVYTNPTAASLQATYAIKPIAVAALGHSCEGDVVNAVVTIRPSPLVLTNLDKIVCNDAVTGITIGTEVTSAAAASYQITRAALPAGLSAGVFAPGTQIVNGATTTNISTDRVVNSTNNPLNITYSVRANTDPSGSGCYGPTETILVTVEPQITATLSGAPGNTNNAKPNICSADDTEITLVSPSNPSAGNVTFNFTAVASVPATVTGMSPGSNLNENDIIEHVLTNTSNNPVDVTYTVTPRANSAAGGNGCIGTAATTIVTVEPKPRLTVTPASITVCEGVPLGIDFASTTVPSTSAASLFFTLTSVEDPNTAGAPVNVSGFSTTLPQNYSVGADRLNDALTNTATEQKSIRYSFTPSFPIASATCLGDPVFVNVTVSPRPVMVPFTVDPKCSGESFSLDYSTSVTEADLSSTLASWTFSYTPSGDPDLTGASNGAGFDLSQVVFNRNADAATVTYAIKARAFGCESNTIHVPVEITPTPKVTGVASSVNVCNNGDINVALASNATNTLYTWLVDDESQPTLTGASDQATPVGGPINYTLANTSTSLSNYTFEITPQVATSLAGKVCVGDPFTMVANVAPPLDGRITTSNGTNESFLCSGSREFLFLEFDGLPLFDVVYREGSNTITLENQGAFKPIQVQPTVTTEYELISVTDAFGCTVNVSEVATVNVNNTDATFSIVGDAQACSPHKVSFQYDQQVGVSYTWKWFDGPDSTTYTAATNELDKIIKHTFENPSPVGVAKYKVYLETSLADTRYPGCLKTTFQEVRVSPNIALGVFADLTTICSGQTVTFTNTSQGATSHRWFYRPQGTTQENDVRATISPAFQLLNNTTQNPMVMEVVYQADNGSCPTTTTVPITVYRGVTASFNEGTIPPFQAGSATVTYTNTSTPLDPAFRYEWTFGTNANPEDHTGITSSIPVTYNLPGLKEVVLVATNIQAESDGFTCSSRFAKTIEILLPPLVAAFKVNPLAACFPVTIAVTENTSTGDTFKWQVIDQSGNIAATALTPSPQFRIVNPGTYDIFLETSSSITGQTAFSQINGVEVFDLPLASLEARPTTLFVPDTELITFNFSTGANFYEWDFDDGTVSEDFEPTHFYNLEGTYNITLVAGFDHGERDIDGDGLMDGNVVCYDTATRQVVAREGGLTKVPNAFTPNKNGPNGGTAGSGTFNDVFLPITKGVANEEGAFIMQIFDRWGTLIFESRNQRMGWDGYDRRGNLVPAGVYVYKLDLRLADGQRTTQVGDVTVIR